MEKPSNLIKIREAPRQLMCSRLSYPLDDHNMEIIGRELESQYMSLVDHNFLGEHLKRVKCSAFVDRGLQSFLIKLVS